jgi:hypothetical protein
MRKSWTTKPRVAAGVLAVVVLGVAGAQVSFGAGTGQTIPSAQTPPAGPNGASAPPKVAGAPAFLSGYQAPTGPIVPVRTILDEAPAAATKAGDATATGIAAVQTTTAQGLEAMSAFRAPTAPSPG